MSHGPVTTTAGSRCPGRYDAGRNRLPTSVSPSLANVTRFIPGRSSCCAAAGAAAIITAAMQARARFVFIIRFRSPSRGLMPDPQQALI